MGSCPDTDIDPCNLTVVRNQIFIPRRLPDYWGSLVYTNKFDESKNSRFNVQVQPSKRRLGITGNISCYILIQCGFYPFSRNSCDPVKSWFLAQHLSRWRIKAESADKTCTLKCNGVPGITGRSRFNLRVLSASLNTSISNENFPYTEINTCKVIK